MKYRKRTVLILSSIIIFGTISGALWAEWGSYNDESWQALKPGTYTDKSWEALKPGTYTDKSWEALQPGTYTNKSWQAKKSGTYEDKSWQALKPGKYNDKAWQTLKPGTYLDKSWLPEKVPCPQHYIKMVRPLLTSVGGKITIRGNRFGEDEGEVFFEGNIPAEVVSWGNRRIEFIVPEGAITGTFKVIKICQSGSAEASHYIKIKSQQVKKAKIL